MVVQFASFRSGQAAFIRNVILKASNGFFFFDKSYVTRRGISNQAPQHYLSDLLRSLIKTLFNHTDCLAELGTPFRMFLMLRSLELRNNPIYAETLCAGNVLLCGAKPRERRDKQLGKASASTCPSEAQISASRTYSTASSVVWRHCVPIWLDLWAKQKMHEGDW